MPLIPLVSQLIDHFGSFQDMLCKMAIETEASHRCCSTVAAGWCCHTGSHTKLPSPTSFSYFLYFSFSFLLLSVLSRLASHSCFLHSFNTKRSTTHTCTCSCYSPLLTTIIKLDIRNTTSAFKIEGFPACMFWFSVYC